MSKCKDCYFFYNGDCTCSGVKMCVGDTTDEAVKKCAKAFDDIQAKIYEIEKSTHMLMATLDKLKELLYPYEQLKEEKNERL